MKDVIQDVNIRAAWEQWETGIILDVNYISNSDSILDRISLRTPEASITPAVNWPPPILPCDWMKYSPHPAVISGSTLDGLFLPQEEGGKSLILHWSLSSKGMGGGNGSVMSTLRPPHPLRDLITSNTVNVPDLKGDDGGRYDGVFPTSKHSIWVPENMFLKLFAGNSS